MAFTGWSSQRRSKKKGSNSYDWEADVEAYETEPYDWEADVEAYEAKPKTEYRKPTFAKSTEYKPSTYRREESKSSRGVSKTPASDWATSGSRRRQTGSGPAWWSTWYKPAKKTKTSRRSGGTSDSSYISRADVGARRALKKALTTTTTTTTTPIKPSEKLPTYTMPERDVGRVKELRTEALSTPMRSLRQESRRALAGISSMEGPLGKEAYRGWAEGLGTGISSIASSATTSAEKLYSSERSEEITASLINYKAELNDYMAQYARETKVTTE